MNKEEFQLFEQECLKDIARGERARALLGSAVWATDVVPYLNKRSVDLSHGSSWKPSTGVFNTDAVALGAAFNGGREEECMNLPTVLGIWVEQGLGAAEKLSKERAKAHKVK